MKRSAPPLQFFAAAAAFDASAMSSRSPFGRGRKQWGRGFSNRPNNEGRSQQFVSGDSHFRSVREANLGLLNGPQPTPNDQGQHYRPQFRQPPQFDHNQGQYHRVPPPQFYQNRGQYHRVTPPSSQNQGFRPPNQFRPRPSKPLDYRNWEYAELTPPPSCERFIILSYNILADYLAINHRSKLYYHIPRHILDWKWRKRNILFELGLWSADIMCFQEVDRFEELEEELKLRGYSGVYQRRTGNAIDGCAVFWRETRFKLLHKESIVFCEIGLRDNVAQLCVLELMRENYTSDVASPSTSSTSSNKIVVCNTHVLYNPKRGDIKLGQVRTLLDRAHVLSKMWNNAPLVLCGDFNCTPKSPLYNFISEQKLDLSGMYRDKLSGQASAEIRSSRPIDSRYNANFRPSIQSAHSSAQAPSVDVSLDDSVPGVESLHHKGEDTPSSSNRFQLQKTKNMAEVSDVTSTDAHSGHVERKIDISLDVVDSCKDGDGLNSFILVDKSTECRTTCNDENKFPVNLINYDVLKSTRSATSIPEKASLSYDEVEQREEAKFSNEHSQQSLSNVNVEKVATKFANLELSLEVSSVDGTEFVSPEPNVDEESTSKQVDASCTNMSRQELEYLTVEVGTTSEDQSSFLSALHSINEVFPPDLAPREGLEVVDSPKEFSSGPIVNQLHSRSDEFEDESSLGLDTETIDVERAAHDPSLWTPSEIATATGKEDSTLVEHPLKLKSTYAEVKDNSGTRDQNGEPMVTSYNRCFLGTVDYIWCSEDLQTVRVLAPIPKHAMQWTPGFPTKKWGSDHIALASELAFAKNASRDDPKVQ